jgi:hypothetical protein
MVIVDEMIFAPGGVRLGWTVSDVEGSPVEYWA